MTQAAPKAMAVIKVLDRVMRSDRGRLLAALTASLRDLSLAEDALQEAAVSALAHWGRSGLPQSPEGWLLTAARRKALDKLRGHRRDALKADALSLLIAHEAVTPDEIPDERLRLIFACCHPALEAKSRVALTLRSVCGLTTPEIARAFLDQETTLGQRISRAKTKIANAGIRFEVPEGEYWPQRLESVLTTVYLIFTTGYVAGGAGPGVGAATGEATGDEAPRDLCHEAEYLMRLINGLRPDDAEIEGALAMMLLTSARRLARVGPDGASRPPGEQDRSLWNAAQLAEGRAILARAVQRRKPGPFQIKAAIADCQMAEPGPDWPQIAALYGALWHHEPTPVVSLNTAVALAEAGEPVRALRIVEDLSASLGDYQPWHAARAALLAMTGNAAEAATAYRVAIAQAPGPAEALFLEQRLARLEKAT